MFHFETDLLQRCLPHPFPFHEVEREGLPCQCLWANILVHGVTTLSPRFAWLSIMYMNKLCGLAEQPARADKWAVGAINRPLLVCQGSIDSQGRTCHAVRSEASVCPSRRILRFAQDDTVLQLKSMPLGCPHAPPPCRLPPPFKSSLTEHYGWPGDRVNVHHGGPTLLSIHDVPNDCFAWLVPGRKRPGQAQGPHHPPFHPLSLQFRSATARSHTGFHTLRKKARTGTRAPPFHLLSL
jgi:hypothetical protein